MKLILHQPECGIPLALGWNLSADWHFPGYLPLE